MHSKTYLIESKNYSMLALMRWDSLRIADDSPARAVHASTADAETPATASTATTSTATASPARAGTAGSSARAAGAQPAVTGGQQALFSRDTVVTRTFDTPGFRGITFHEVHARSLISKVPEASRVPFRWTINPYRGCSHACVYCFARNTHTYLDLDAGHDFDTQIVVKVNAVELLRRELKSARWTGEHIAMGTNVDCYQRAEGRYRLMPGIIAALTEAANPFSILTKGTLILRDIDLLATAASVTEVGLNVSVGIVDKSLSRSIEPGTPSPDRRLAACAALSERGLRCGVLMGPVVPFLSDSPGQLDDAVRKIANAGAAHVSPIVLHLRPGAREWFLRWLSANHPELVDAYRDLYGSRAYAPASYQRQIAEQVAELARKHGVGRTTPAGARRVPGVNVIRGTKTASGRAGPASPREPEKSGPVQLSLM
jgi:DNA repair photolyase